MDKRVSLKWLDFGDFGFSDDYLAQLFAKYGYENVFVYEPSSLGKGPDIVLDRAGLFDQVEKRIAAKNRYFTHSGTFHADDVAATGLMRIMFPNASVVRCESEKDIVSTKDFAFDVGLGPFDHHQRDRKCEDFCPCAALLIFRLLFPAWAERKLGLYSKGYGDVIESAMYEMHNKFFLDLALTDNFGQAQYPNPLAYLLTPNKGDLEGFLKASSFVGDRLLDRFAMLVSANLSTACVVKEIEKEGGKPKALRMDDNSFFSTFGFPSYVKYVMFKSNRDEGCFNIMCLDDAKLPELPASKVKFVHPNGFMCVVNDSGVFDTWFNPLIINHERVTPIMSADEIERNLKS